VSRGAARRTLQPVVGPSCQFHGTGHSAVIVSFCQQHSRQPHAEYQSNTRKARSVFHRLGRPSPVRLDRHPAGVRVSSATCLVVALRRRRSILGDALVGRDAGRRR
jgi:hypothetical protein